MNIITRNKTKADCGIVAAYNASSWCNMGISYDDIVPVAEVVGYDKEKGITPRDFDELVRALDMPARMLQKTNPFEIQKIVRTGQAVIVLYVEKGKKFGHAITIFPQRDHIKIINGDKNKWTTWNDFAAEIHAGIISLNAWVLPFRERQIA